MVRSEHSLFKANRDNAAALRDGLTPESSRTAARHGVMVHVTI